MHNSQLNGRRYDPRMKTDVIGGDGFAEIHPDERVGSQVDPVQVIWRRLWIVLLVALGMAGLTAGATFVQTPTYEASIKLLVGQKPSDGAPGDLGNEIQGLQQLTATMVEAVDTRPVAEAVIRSSGVSASPEQLLENLSAEQVQDTQFVEVSYEDTDPERAQRIVNTVGEVFSEKVSEVSPSANAISATLWEPAIVPDSPVSPNPMRNILLALVLGLMLGVGLAFLLDYADDDWESPEEVEKVTGVPTYGVIPQFKVPRSKKKGDD